MALDPLRVEPYIQPAILVNPSDGSYINPAGTSPVASFEGGEKDVAAAGTAEALAASTACSWVIIQAKRSNTGLVAVGGSDVVVGTNGIDLEAGAVMTLPIADLASVFVDAATNDEGVTFVYGA